MNSHYVSHMLQKRPEKCELINKLHINTKKKIFKSAISCPDIQRNISQCFITPRTRIDQLWSGTWLEAIVFHCNNFDYFHIKLDYTQNKSVQIHGNLINVLNVIIVKIIIFQWNEDMKLKIKFY